MSTPEHDYAREERMRGAANAMYDALKDLARIAKRFLDAHDDGERLTVADWRDLNAVTDNARAALAKVDAP